MSKEVAVDTSPGFKYDPAAWAWHDRAACNGAPERDAHTMVSPGGGNTDAHDRKMIEQYCDACPVLAQCAAWAVREVDFVGIAGGRRWTGEHRKAQVQARLAAERNRVVEAAEREWANSFG